MPKKKSPYSQTPVVPEKKIAGHNPVGSVELGTATPKMVPGISGALPGSPGRPKEVAVARHKIHPNRHAGHLRLSGHPGAHQIGLKLPHVAKVPAGVHMRKPKRFK